VLLRADAFPGRVMTAEVAQITPKGDTARKAYRVRLNLPNDTPLMIGMTVEANIILREARDAVLVPPAAVVLPDRPRGAPATVPGTTRAATIWVVEKETAQRREVEIGVNDGLVVAVWITHPLSIGRDEAGHSATHRGGIRALGNAEALNDFF
jgi:multidrug efflux pump subunit AcrA (membrane-fusion protein)